MARESSNPATEREREGIKAKGRNITRECSTQGSFSESFGGGKLARQGGGALNSRSEVVRGPFEDGFKALFQWKPSVGRTKHLGFCGGTVPGEGQLWCLRKERGRERRESKDKKRDSR